MAKKLENVVFIHVLGGIDFHQARSLHHLRGRDGGGRESHAVMDLGPTLARYVRMRPRMPAWSLEPQAFKSAVLSVTWFVVFDRTCVVRVCVCVFVCVCVCVCE